MQSDHLLHCIGNVYLFKEIFLEGCGNSCGELAQWGCTRSSEEQVELWSAPFIPLSNKAMS